eukprot:6210785-Pleurochrysis_carterae.AAC.8
MKNLNQTSQTSRQSHSDFNSIVGNPSLEVASSGRLRRSSSAPRARAWQRGGDARRPSLPVLVRQLQPSLPIALARGRARSTAYDELDDAPSSICLLHISPGGSCAIAAQTSVQLSRVSHLRDTSTTATLNTAITTKRRGTPTLNYTALNLDIAAVFKLTMSDFKTLDMYIECANVILLGTELAMHHAGLRW